MVGAGVLGAGRAAAVPADAHPERTDRDRRVFAHAVASGDPAATAVIIWTRVTPVPEARPGSATGPDVTVTWQVAEDAAFTRIAAAGTARTTAARDHTVKVDVTGLAPARDYHYRFRVDGGPADGALSPTGRTRTAPAPGAAVDRLRLGVCSCANWEAGYFAGYRYLAERGDLDAIVHLGDYIYEYEHGGYTGPGGAVRVHEPAHETVTLADYRARMAQYATDPDLAAMRTAVPLIATWDDHESANDSHREGAENHQPHEGDWARRRAASAQAYFEWMPTRPQSLDSGGHLYRRLRFGDLVELSMLDLRSYRDRPPTGPLDAATIDDPDRTMTGAAQFDWLVDGLAASDAQWKLIGNSVMISPVLVPPVDREVAAAVTGLLGLPADGVPYNTDQWDGYGAERARLLGRIVDDGVSDVVFLTGDIHSSWVCEVPELPGRPDRVAAVEYVTPSITSSNIDDMLALPEGNPVSAGLQAALQTANPHVRAVDLDRHGCLILDVTAERVQADYWFLTDKADARSPLVYGFSMATAAGSARVAPAPGPLA